MLGLYVGYQKEQVTNSLFAFSVITSANCSKISLIDKIKLVAYPGSWISSSVNARLDFGSRLNDFHNNGLRETLTRPIVLDVNIER